MRRAATSEGFCARLGGRGSIVGHSSVRILAIASSIAALSPAGWAHPNHHFAQLAPAPPNETSRLPAWIGRADLQARLAVTISDAKSGQPTPARIRITDANGQPLGARFPLTLAVAAEARLAIPGTVQGLPPEAIGIMYGQKDTAQGYAFQPDGSFYVNGSFELPMPAGRFLLTICKGYEFEHDRHEITLKAGEQVKRAIALRRWIDMPQRGWYSADGHIHLRRSPRDNPLIIDWIAAEDVHVGVLLQMGDIRTTYFPQYGFGQRGHYLAGDRLLTSGQEEPRTGELGHAISFGAGQFIRFASEYHAYDKIFDRIHELGGLSGYAHQAMSFHGYRGLTLDVLTGKIDFLELLQFCVPEGAMVTDHYYRLLDLGYKLTALAGSDFPWCGRGRRPGEEQVGPQIGDARFYTHVGEPFSHVRWLDAVKAGRTFVTSGPMLELHVNGQLPGAMLNAGPGETLRIRAKAHGHAAQIPLQRLQLVAHGQVIGEVQPGAHNQSSAELILDHELTPSHGLWIAARADAGPTQMAHTTPIYVTVNGDGFHNRRSLAAQIETSRRYLREIRELLSSDMPVADRPMPTRVKAHLEQRLVEAERALDERATLR